MLDFNKYPISNLNKIVGPINSLIDKALTLERREQTQRTYLGASRLGAPCSRMLQYEYISSQSKEGNSSGNNKGFVFPVVESQTLRIFEAGHLFEELAARWLRLAGFTLVTQDSQGKQFGFIVAGGKIAGHIDGVIVSTPVSLEIPTFTANSTDANNTALGMSYPALWEAKSMNAKSWSDTAKKGLALSKPIYAAQIALYQAYMEESIPGISSNPALFTAINKNTCEIYHELIPFDADLAQRMSDKAVNIIRATECRELLPRSYSSKEFYECKMCAYKERCWENI